MDCPICYQPIALEDEAYVATCYHRFCHKCIAEWTVQQRRHPIHNISGGGRGNMPDYRCPMCKQPYLYILFDCVLNSFRVEFVDDEAQRRGCVPSGGTGMALSAGHRRRRALYVTQPRQTPQLPQQQQPEHPVRVHPLQGLGQGEVQDSGPGPCPKAQDLASQGAAGGTVQDPAATVTTRAAGKRTVAGCAAPAVKMRRHDDPELRVFVERELQALLLQEDVGMLLEHVLGVVKNISGSTGASSGNASRCAVASGSGISVSVLRNSRYVPPPAKRTRTMAPSLPPRQEFERVMSTEMESFLQQKGHMFASQLYMFLVSGLSVRGYDELVFGSDVAPQGMVDKKVSEGTERVGVGSGRQVIQDIVDLVDDEEYDDDDDLSDG
ncbi:hypothetical protein VaNZ11_014274 [Volvox africanus]|uniref:RING-type domain-containing protein n=1 Tax=Volvox africanus TaxID=51714 RepID=A0ABQ5SJS1_9CHLO|nr:hypothetical protein VaNZ11_014274 [Volvox africanus]